MTSAKWLSRVKSALAVAVGVFAFALQAGTYVSSADWVKQDDGSWRSGAISHDQASVLANRNLVAKPGFVSFEWKVSSEEDYDKLRFFADGEEVSTISGYEDWATVRFPVRGEGSHTLEWVYSKDGSVSDGYDCGWIRNVTFSEGDYTVSLDAQGGELKGTSIPAMDGEEIGELPRPVYPGHAFLGWWTAMEGGEKVAPDTILTNGVTTLYARWKESEYDFDGAEWTVEEDGVLKSPSLVEGESSTLIKYVNGEGTLSFSVRASMEDGTFNGGYRVYIDDEYACGDGLAPSSTYSDEVKVVVAGVGRHTVRIQRWSEYDYGEARTGFVWVRGLNFAETDSWIDQVKSYAIEIEGVKGSVKIPCALLSLPYANANEQWYDYDYVGLAKWTAPKTGYFVFDRWGLYEAGGHGLASVEDGAYAYDRQYGRTWFTKVEEGKTYFIATWNYDYDDDDNRVASISWHEVPAFEIGVDDDMYVWYVGMPPSDLVIPSDAESVGDRSFEKGYGIESVDIPSSVAIIGNKAFYGCTNLANVTFRSKLPPSFGYWDWDDDLWDEVWVDCGITDVFYACSTGLTVRVPSSWGWASGPVEYDYEYWDDYDNYYSGKRTIMVECIPDFQVVLDPNEDGAGVIVTNTVPANFAIRDAFELPVPKKEGRALVGWFTAPDGGDEIDGDYVVTTNLTIYGHWTDAVEAVIDAGAEGATVGDGATNIVFAVGEKVLAKLSALSGTRSGFMLTGWSVVRESGNVPVDENTVAEAGMTFKAEWTETVSVTFKNDEADTEPYAVVTLAKGEAVGEENMPADPFDYNVDENGFCRLFSQWITISAATGRTITVINGSIVTNLEVSVTTNTFDATTVVEDVTTAFGDWIRAAEVVFDCGEYGYFGEVNMYGALVGETITKPVRIALGETLGELPTPDVNYYGVAFGGWRYNAGEEQHENLEDGSVKTNFVEVVRDATPETVVDKGLRINAWYTKTVRFEANGGSVEPKTGKFEIGKPFGELPVATRDGFEFVGWDGGYWDQREYWDEENECWDYEDVWISRPVDTNTVVTAEMATLYAIWNRVLTFDVDGTVTTNRCAEGAEMEFPADPVPSAGLSFDGWYDEAGNKVDAASWNKTAYDEFGDELPRPGSLTARWYNVTVTFDAKGGNCDEAERRLMAGDLLGELPEATREGFELAGWFYVDDGAATNQLAATTPVVTNMDAFAKWNVRVTFVEDGVTNEQVVAEGAAVALPEPATREGYDFAGWFDADGNLVETVTADAAMALEAKWKVSATFIAGVGQFEGEATNVVVTKVFENSLFGDARPADPVREGCTFEGWLDADGNIVVDETEISSSAEFTAKWSNVTVTFDARGGDCEEAERKLMFGDRLGELPVATRDGLELVGWFCDVVTNETTVAVALTPDMTIEANLGAYAKWNARVVIDGVETNVAEGAEVALPPAPEAEGRDFAGWYDAVTGEKFEAAVVTANQSVSLKARWKVAAVFDAGEGSFGTTNAVEASVFDDAPVGDAIPAVDPVREGRVFMGWLVGEGDDTVEIGRDSVIGSAAVVRAKWGFNVAFDAGDGKWPLFDESGFVVSTTNVLVVAVGEGESLGDDMPEAPVLDGRMLVGWYFIDADTNEVEFTAESVVGTNMTVTARWAEPVTVTFDANGGDVAEPSRVIAKGSEIGELPEPTLNGSAFLGWYASDEGGEPVKATDTFAEDVTLHARWASGWKVTFDANGGTTDEPVRYVEKGKALGSLPTATRKGYSLVGWYTAKTKGKAVKATVKPAKDVTYYAIWKVASYKVTVFADGSGKATGGKSYAVGKKVALAAKPAKGWVFVGWDYLVADEDEVDGFWPAYEQQIRQPSVSFAMPACEVVVFAVFAKAKQDTTPGVSLDYEGPWHLASDGERVLGIGVDSLTYAAATVALPAGLKNGMKLAKVPGTDDQWTLKVTSLANCQPGVYKLTIKAKNRAGKTGTASIQVIAPNTTVAVDKGALSLSEELAKAADTEDPYELYVGMKFDWASLGVKAASGWKLASVSGLPTGLKWNAKTGKVTGICSKAGMFTATFAVKKGKTTYKASVTFNVKPLPAYAIGTFKGWTSASVDSAAGPDAASRAVTITASSAGKLSAKVGTYSFSCNGWSFGESGNLVAKLTGKRTVGKGKSAKKYEDALEIALAQGADWNAIQVTGTVKTVLSGTTEPMNEDVYVFAQRNAFADADNEEVAEIATALADLKTISLGVAEAPDDAGYQYELVADGAAKGKVAVKADGTATFFGVIGGKSVSASAVVEVGGDFNASVRFFTSSCVVEVAFNRDASGEYAYSSGRVWVK